MDGLSVAANIVGIATAGVAISIKLVTLATQISTASERVTSIGNDISLTSGVLHQLGELMTQKTTDDGISIFSQGGLETTRTSAAVCERIFRKVEKEVSKASEQIRSCKRLDRGKLKLSKAERAKWPFLQPSIDSLRADLREAKGTLMLMLQVTSLALSKRMADLNQSASATSIEQRDFMRAIVALEQQQHGSDQYIKGTERSVAEAAPQRKNPLKTESITSASSGDDTATSHGVSLPSTLPTRPNIQARSIRQIAEVRKLPEQFSRASTGSNITTSSDIGLGSMTDLNAMQMPKLESAGSSSRTLWSDHSDDRNSLEQATTKQDNQCEPETTAKELQLFLLKPMVRDYFDRIELSWSLYDTKSHELAIRKHMDKNETDGTPSVIDMLENLQAYEQQVIDTELKHTHTAPGASLLALKRTKTDIRHRDMTLKDVPGLQFVVERQVIRPSPAIFRLGTVAGKNKKGLYVSRDAYDRHEAKNSHIGPSRIISEEGSWISAAENLNLAPHTLIETGAQSGRSSLAVPTNLFPQPRGEAQLDCGQRRDSYSMSLDRDPSDPDTLVDHEHEQSLQQSNAVGSDGMSWLELDLGEASVETDRMVDHDGRLRDDSEDVAEVFDEDKREGSSAGFLGCTVVKEGMIQDKQGKIVGTVVEGDSTLLVGHTVKEDGHIIDEDGNVAGHAERFEGMEEDIADASVPEAEREAKSEGPFAGLEECIVAENGLIKDPAGNTVGTVVEGNAKDLIGRMIDEDGDIIDKYGNVKGRAEPYDEPEEEVADLSSLDGKVVDRDGNVVDEYKRIIGRIYEGNIDEIFGKRVDAQGHIWNDSGKVVGQAELCSGDRSELPKESSDAFNVPDRTEDKITMAQDARYQRPELMFHYPRPSYDDEKNTQVDMTHNSELPLSVFSPATNQLAYPIISRARTPSPNARLQMMSLETDQGTIQVPIAVPSSLETRNGKRQRNASASHRFRQRRKEKERETTSTIASLQQQVEFMKEDLASARAGSGESTKESLKSAKPNKKRWHDEQVPELAIMEKKRKIIPEDLLSIECMDDDALVVDLLGKYTTLFQ